MMKIYKNEIRVQQINLLNRHIYAILTGNFALGIGIIIVFWSEVSFPMLSAWSLTFLTIILYRAFVAHRYRTCENRSKNINIWGILFSIGAGASGIAWATLTLLFFLPDKPEYVLFIACMYAGLAASATVSTSAYMPAFYAFIIPATIPFAIRCLLEGGTVYTTIGVTGIVYFAITIVFARNINANITEMKRLQLVNEDLVKDLEQQKQTAENAVREKNSFLAAASHDLRQPLHASGLLLAVLQDHVKGEEGNAILDIVLKSNEALNHLFNSLLDVSRLDAGVLEAHPRHIKVDELMSSLESEYRLQATNKGLSFNIACQDTAVFSDPVLLHRIIGNLLSNALTYTDKGSVSIRCHQQSEGQVAIEVADTGVGIPESEIDHIFSEYYQINNPERDRSKGLGLGLAIVKRLCTLMGIDIQCQSTPGVQTSFRLTLTSGDAKQVVQDKTIPEIISLEGVVILVIDDDKDVLKGMQKLLSTWGCETLLADSAEQAVQVLSVSEKAPSIVFADYRLRERKTGVEAIQTVFDELNRNIPAVIITGDTSSERLREAKNSQFRLLHKPVNPGEMRATLQQELSSTQA